MLLERCNLVLVVLMENVTLKMVLVCLQQRTFDASVERRRNDLVVILGVHVGSLDLLEDKTVKTLLEMTFVLPSQPNQNRVESFEGCGPR